MTKPIKVREDTGRYVIEEGDPELFGEFRFALDRRDTFPAGDTIRTNIGWYRTYRGALNALSMERASESSPAHLG